MGIQGPTVADLNFRASNEINRNLVGLPAPVTIRVYQLVSAQAFNEADFLRLFDRDAAILGRDLIAREEFVIQPGQRLRLIQELRPGARFIGVAVFYRDVERTSWRAVTLPPPNRTSIFEISVQPQAVLLNTVG